MQWKQFQRQFLSALTPLYEQSEAEAMFYSWLQKRKNWSRLQFFSLAEPEHLAEKELVVYLEELNQLAKGLPLQYLLGEVQFAGLDLKIGPGALIPRPETEEWFFAFLQAHPGFKPRTIADWCTGSGCLALAAKNKLPQARVYAFDVSNEALALAALNAEKTKLAIHVEKDNLEMPKEQIQKFQWVLCNPPYIEPHESVSMHPNVLQFEPSIALFAPNGSPLHFYSLLLEWCKIHLDKQGWLAWEINPVYASGCQELLEANGFEQIQTFIDLQGKPRAQFAHKP